MEGDPGSETLRAVEADFFQLQGLMPEGAGYHEGPACL